jgi:hypothetical protein
MSPVVGWLSELLPLWGCLTRSFFRIPPDLCAFASLREIFLNDLGAVSPTRMPIRE